MLNINVVTLFPDLFRENLKVLPFNRAIKDDLLSVNLINLRDFAIDSRGSVDDKTYGGGTGMVIRPEPVFDAVESIEKAGKSKVVLLSPRGKRFNQQMAREFSKLDQITLIAGRYEGIDARVETSLADEVVSIGDFVLSGGELPALVVMEAIARLLPGVLEKEATENESFEKGIIEYPQYTRPEEYRELKVPEVLLSGNHAEIEKWRKENSPQV